VIQRKGTGGNGETFTVRKISNGIGVEKIFAIISPSIEKIEVKREGSVRRARLYYLRGKQGKAAKVKEKSFAARKRKQIAATAVTKTAATTATPAAPLTPAPNKSEAEIPQT